MNRAALLLLLTTVIASVACMHLVRELRAERERTAQLQSRVAELERLNREVPTAPASPFASVPPELPLVEASPHAMTLSPPAAAPTAAATAVPVERAAQFRRHFERQREMLRDPDYREAMRAQHRFGFLSSYPNLAAELGLTQAQTDAFFDLLAEQQLREMEDREAPYFHEAPPDSSVLREEGELARRRHEQYQSEIETLLGPSKYEAWKTYQETLGQRYRVASLQSSLAMAGAPLNEAQSNALLSSLVAEQRRQQQAAASTGKFAPFDNVTGPAAMEAWINVRVQEQERLLSALRSELTEQQIAHLEGLFSNEIEMQRAHLKMQRAQPEGTPDHVVFSTSHYGALGVAAPIVVERVDAQEPPANESTP